MRVQKLDKTCATLKDLSIPPHLKTGKFTLLCWDCSGRGYWSGRGKLMNPEPCLENSLLPCQKSHSASSQAV